MVHANNAIKWKMELEIVHESLLSNIERKLKLKQNEKQKKKNYAKQCLSHGLLNNFLVRMKNILF